MTKVARNFPRQSVFIASSYTRQPMRPKPTYTSQSQTRYYFHGDLVEPSDRRAEAGDYYCDRCETFVRRDHFYRPSSPHSGDLENIAHYQQMAKNWHATSRQYRPTTSLNLFF